MEFSYSAHTKFFWFMKVFLNYFSKHFSNSFFFLTLNKNYPASLMYVTITHHQNLTSLLNLLIIYLVHQIFSMKVGITFLALNFLLFGLCNNCLVRHQIHLQDQLLLHCLLFSYQKALTFFPFIAIKALKDLDFDLD